jgi:hypothetical protein
MRAAAFLFQKGRKPNHDLKTTPHLIAFTYITNEGAARLHFPPKNLLAARGKPFERTRGALFRGVRPLAPPASKMYLPFSFK